jgi:hypothetical protein
LTGSGRSSSSEQEVMNPTGNSIARKANRKNLKFLIDMVEILVRKAAWASARTIKTAFPAIKVPENFEAALRAF